MAQKDQRPLRAEQSFLGHRHGCGAHRDDLLRVDCTGFRRFVPGLKFEIGHGPSK